MHHRKNRLGTALDLLTESFAPGIGLRGVFEEPFGWVARLRCLEPAPWRHRRWLVAASALAVVIACSLFVPMPAVEAQSSAPERSAGPPDGDWYFREETRWERFVLFVRTGSKIRSESEFWIGDGRAAFIEEGRRVILDRARNTLTYVNTRDRTYVEAELPLDFPRLFSDALRRNRREMLFGAEVEPTGRTAEIRGYECSEYVVTQWEERDGRRSNHRQVNVWATTEVEADFTLAEQLLDNLRRLTPRTDRGVEELKKIRGMQLRLDFGQAGNFLVRERTVAEDVEIARRTPPQGVYEVPAGYTRKEQLTPSDF